MFTFLMDHYDWLIAALAGHVSLSGAGVAFTWIKAEYAKFMTSGKSDVSALNARIAALEAAAKAAATVPQGPANTAPVVPAAH